MDRIISITPKDKTKPIHYEPKDWLRKAIILQTAEVGKKAIFTNPLTFGNLVTSTVIGIVETDPDIRVIETKNTFYKIQKIGN